MGYANLAFGWCWITTGLIVGTLMGLFFHRDNWLGGYDSWPRRLIRLGHVAMIALGAMNILFALSLDHVALARWEADICRWSLIVGAVSMPTVCGLSAWRKPLRHLFFIPVTSLLTATITFSIGILKSGSAS